MPDTIFKRNLNKFLCDLSQVNFLYFYQKKNWLYLRPHLKAFPVFNVLETCRVYLLAIDLGIVKFIKKFIERFFEKCEICRHGPNYVQKL